MLCSVLDWPALCYRMPKAWLRWFLDNPSRPPASSRARDLVFGGETCVMSAGALQAFTVGPMYAGAEGSLRLYQLVQFNQQVIAGHCAAL